MNIKNEIYAFFTLRGNEKTTCTKCRRPINCGDRVGMIYDVNGMECFCKNCLFVSYQYMFLSPEIPKYRSEQVMIFYRFFTSEG